nr:mannose-1-phosphate guanyltransferase alpha [Tanacetum cinerariifolium]
LLSKASPNIIAPTYIHPTAQIDPSAKIGPNVAIGPGVQIEAGVRVKDAIVMEGSTLEKHSAVLDAIVGMDCHIGQWARVDGSPEPE